MIRANNQFDVLWISGMPRSGTTWLSQIFASSPEVRLKSCPLFSYEFKNMLGMDSTADQWRNMFSDLYDMESEYLDQEHLRKHGLVPEFEDKVDAPDNLVIKSTRFHDLLPCLIELCPEVRFVHIVRHPCAAIYSWLSDPDEFPASADPEKEWRTGSCRKGGPGEFWGFDDWKHVTRQATGLSVRYPKRFRIIRYEELRQHPLEKARELFAFAGISLGRQTEEFIRLSQSRHDQHKHSVFKLPDRIDRWRNELDSEIIDVCMSEIRGTALEVFAR